MRRLSHEQYTVGWICALPLEMAAAIAMLDETHEDLPVKSNDGNAYTLGRIGKHNLVIACLPSGQYGTTSATVVAIQLLSSFPSIKFGLMVGIGGGIPSSKVDIRLGDVVVSQPSATHGGVVQYDFGKALQGDRFQRRGLLNCPPQALLTALARLQAKHRVSRSAIPTYLAEMMRKYPHMRRDYSPDGLLDILHEAGHHALTSVNPLNLNATRIVPRPKRATSEPVIHYGLIASGNQVVKDSIKRDRLAGELGAYCVEMEAAGLMNHYPCLLVRGICDYADAQKDSKWQGYAAAVASAYAKELLTVTSASLTLQSPRVRENLTILDTRFARPLSLGSMTVVGNFIGRHDELGWLRAKLTWKTHPRRRIIVLHGLGGIGKTQLAVRFARLNQNDYSAVFLIKCRDRTTLLQSLASIGPQIHASDGSEGCSPVLSLEQRAQRVLDWLTLSQNPKWLLIYDNVCHSDKAGYNISDFFPSADHGSIIITTRILSFTELGESLNVTKLSRGETNQLLLQSSGLWQSSKDGHYLNEGRFTPYNRELVSRLDGHPLATVIAGMFIRRTGISLSKYLQIYKTSWRALQIKSTALDTHGYRSVIHTWDLSYREIQDRNPIAAELLIIVAFYNHHDVSLDVLKNAAKYSDSPQWFRDLVSEDLSFATVVGVLVDFSMIERGHGNEWCRRGIMQKDNVRKTRYQHMVLVSIGAMASTPNNADCYLLQRRLIPHAVSILGELSNLFLSHGMLCEAEKAYKLAYAGSIRIFGRCHHSALASAKNLAKLYCLKGQFGEALRAYKQALMRQESALGPEHPLTLSTLNDFGTFFCLQEKLDKAQSLYQRAFAIRISAFGPDHFSTLALFNNLGNVFSRTGNLKDAEAFYKQALKGRESLLGAKHPYTLATVNNLGNLYLHQGLTDRAEGLYRRALQGRQNILGNQHLLTLARYKDAEDMYKMSLCGPTINNLGNLYCDLQRWEEAERMYERALSGRNLLLGPAHPSTLATFNNLKNLLLYQGRIEELGMLFRQPLLIDKHERQTAEDDLSWVSRRRKADVKFFLPSLSLPKYFRRI
ncbi:hypothetical protein BDV23DRAFT_192206 [Aspergillus alliaceus]|uniref:Nucleoside phosphorylase domain-containing protein n=1 Tax=Petromyces alliaceus TaxID=209559 RepID=A0A5N7CQN8_PETAA|nr:hypothetical protein BDV23DRAFT_192206 [Aspergillus alliaceus]